MYCHAHRTCTAGKTYGEVRRAYRDCVVIGVIRGAESVMFDVLDKEVMGHTDRLIMLSYVTSPAVRVLLVVLRCDLYRWNVLLECTACRLCV